MVKSPLPQDRGAPLPAAGLTETHVVSDLAIEGDGYFLLRGGTNDFPAFRLTRYGGFQINEDGVLVSSSGLGVMGESAYGTRCEPVVLRPSEEGESSPVVAYSVGRDGAIWITHAGGRTRSSGRILVWRPSGRGSLRRLDELDYEWVGMPDDWERECIRPGVAEGVTIRSGWIEMPEAELQVVRYDRSRSGGGSGLPVRLGMPLTVYLDGPGYLLVRDPLTDTRYATRCGALKMDWDGWLVTRVGGRRVQGWTDAAPANPSDLRFEIVRSFESEAVAAGSSLVQGSIDAAGNVVAFMSDGSRVHRGRLAVARYRHPERLRPVGQGCFEGLEPAEPEPMSPNDGSQDPRTRFREGEFDPVHWSAEVRDAFRWQARFWQGPLLRSEDSAMLAISGPGFFLVRSPIDSTVRLTRNGRFHWTDEGCLEADDGGGRLLGMNTDGQLALVEVRCPAEVCEIDRDGLLVGTTADGFRFGGSRIVLATVPDVSELEEPIPGYYRVREGRGPTRTFDWGRPGHDGRGGIVQRALEILGETAEDWNLLLPERGTQVRLFGMGWRRTLQTTDDLVNWRDLFIDDADGVPRPVASGNPGTGPAAVALGGSVFDGFDPRGPIRFYRMLVEPR